MSYRLGSPPRMRGKPVYDGRQNPRSGITPADAGKTSLNGIFSATGLGSPPRMRGKPSLFLHFFKLDRITPADAGKTKADQRTVKHDEDHPRGCGENNECPLLKSRGQGSPPRMRGKRRRLTQTALYRRITPADAGKTMSCVPTASLM